MNLRHLSRCVAVAMLLSVGCVSDDDTSASGSGALGKGSFRQVCGAADALCDAGATDLALPARLALGATMQVSYTGRIPNAPNGDPAVMTVVAASPSMLATEGGLLRALAPGFSAVLAHTDLGTVTDFAHVHVVPIGTLGIDGPASTHVGELITARVTPRDADGESLGGSVSYTWESADPGVAAIDDASAGNAASIRGIQPGVTTITVTAGDVIGELSVTVEAS